MITEPPGICYVDPSQGKGDLQVVAGCPGSGGQKRIIRIVGNANGSNPFLAAPAPGRVFIGCPGAGYSGI